jgi:hypothetical protein
MLENGNYSAWFRTQQGEATGVVVLNEGRVTGGDNVSSYSGSYFVDGDKFTAAISTWRHTQGPPSVFGIDNVDLTLTGKSTPTTASCAGTAKQAPGLTFEATLIRIAEAPSAPPRAPIRGRGILRLPTLSAREQHRR